MQSRPRERPHPILAGHDTANRPASKALPAVADIRRGEESSNRQPFLTQPSIQLAWRFKTPEGLCPGRSAGFPALRVEPVHLGHQIELSPPHLRRKWLLDVRVPHRAGKILPFAILIGEQPERVGGNSPCPPQRDDGPTDFYVAAMPGVLSLWAVREQHVEVNR